MPTAGVRTHLSLPVVCWGQGGAKPPGSLTEPPSPRPPLPAAFVAASWLDALRQHKAEPRGISAAIFSAPLLTNKLLRAGDGEASAAAGPPPRAPPLRRASWPGRRHGATGNALPSPAPRIASASSPLCADPEMPPLRSNGERGRREHSGMRPRCPAACRLRHQAPPFPPSRVERAQRAASLSLASCQTQSGCFGTAIQ